jgi:hypothetical protein
VKANFARREKEGWRVRLREKSYITNSELYGAEELTHDP